MDERSPTSLHHAGPAAIPEPPPLILIVDDELDVILILHRLLRDLAPECDIITSTDPLEALDRIRGRTVSLLITDVSMPVMNGVDLAAQIKERRPETQILLITACPNGQVQQRALDQGIEYFLSKPFAFADLERIVGTALHHDEASGQETESSLP
jgi:two-component system, response regulator, stage 0 sporulation protein F